MTARYQVKNWPGVAVRIDSYKQRWEPDTCLMQDEEGNEWEEETGEGEWIDDTDSNQVIVVMVGDDHRHTVDADDLTKINDLDYCHVCGQIGCTHDGWERD